MPATCHRVVGIIDVEENPEFRPQHASAWDPTPLAAVPSSTKLYSATKVTAEIEQLAADLKIEYERYQRQSRV